MSSFKERSLFAKGAALTVVTNDVTIFNWTATDTTMTPTSVGDGASPGATGNIVFNATDSVAAAAMQVAIRALGGIYATATVVAGVTADNMVITVFGGYDVTWVKTGGTGTITESGAAGSDTAVPGSVAYTAFLGGRFPKPKRIHAKGWIDNSLDISVTDRDSKNVFVATGIDTNNAGADLPFLKLITADGVAGEDGAAAANTSGGVFSGPLTVKVTASAPYADLGRSARLSLVFADEGERARRVLKRTSGPRTLQSGTFSLGADFGNIKRIRIENGGPGTPDTGVAPTLTDADGLPIYVKTSTDYTTPVIEQLSHEGVDQGNTAVADLLDCIAHSPITIAGTGQTTGTMTYTVWVEV